jgi:hypothetical protein
LAECAARGEPDALIARWSKSGGDPLGRPRARPYALVGRERATSLLNRREARGARAMHLCRPLDGGDRANWMVVEQRKSVGVERLLVCVCTATG